MSDENDSWLEGIGVNVSGVLGSVQETATAVIEELPVFAQAPPVADEVAGPAFSGVGEVVSGVVDSVQGAVTGVAEALGGGGDTPTGPTATAKIAVKANGDGSFTVTGSGFTQQLVTVRAADDFVGNRFFPTETKDGKLAFTTPKICVAEGAIHFSVLAGTFPLVSDLLSNFADSTCGPQVAPEKGKDDPEPSPDPPDNQTEKVHACLVTVFSTKVKYFIKDMTSGKMLVDGVEKGGGEKICFDCESTGAPDTGRVQYSRASDESGGGRTAGRIVLVTHNTDTDMQE